MNNKKYTKSEILNSKIFTNIEKDILQFILDEKLVTIDYAKKSIEVFLKREVQ